MTVNPIALPRLNQTGLCEWQDVESNDQALRAAIESVQEQVTAVGGVKWAGSKVTAGEESRTNTSFGTLTTADEIKGVVVPENGLIQIGYWAQLKSSVGGAGRVAFFLGSNQVKQVAEGPPVGSEQSTESAFEVFTSSGRGIERSPFVGAEAPASTGQVLCVGSPTLGGGLCTVFSAAGTYDISVQYRATSGSVTAKERKLWVAVLG